MIERRTSAFITVLALSLLSAPSLGAQADTARRVSLDSVRIVAERAPTSLGNITASVTRISGEQLVRMPMRTFADVLRLVPGFAVVDRDGLGHDAQPIVRGFYGGGEAEYVQLLIDGKPVSQVQNGVVAWDALPPAVSIEAVEIMRGNSSSLWGDAAIGAVINVITRKGGDSPVSRADFQTGTHGATRSGIAIDGRIGSRAIAVNAAADVADGFRHHSERRTFRLNTAFTLLQSERSRIALSTRSHWRRFDEPGALIESLAAQRDTSDPLFRFDNTSDDLYALQLDGERALSGNVSLSVSVLGERRDMQSMRTLALAPGFGDTRERDAASNRVWSTVQLQIAETPLPWRDRFTMGTDLYSNSLRSAWYGVHLGDRDSYASAAGTRGALDADGDAQRRAAALFAQYAVFPVERLQFTLGARADHIADSYASADFLRNWSATHTAISPKAGVSFKYVERPGSSGSVFVNGSGSFKAPTLDQLYDQRPVPLPDPPFKATTSNASLRPQFGNAVEVGVYHAAQVPRAGSVLLSVSGYDTHMRDELDFDVATLRYVNIARSRHRGLETGLQWAPSASVPLSAVVNYTAQSVTSRSGANLGKQLKAIPRQMIGAGFNTTFNALDASVMISHTGSGWVDDANNVRLPGFTRTDVRVRYSFSWFALHADVTNLMDARYNTTSFLDPAGSGQQYLSPAAGRVIQVGFGNVR